MVPAAVAWSALPASGAVLLVPERRPPAPIARRVGGATRLGPLGQRAASCVSLADLAACVAGHPAKTAPHASLAHTICLRERFRDILARNAQQAVSVLHSQLLPRTIVPNAHLASLGRQLVQAVRSLALSAPLARFSHVLQWIRRAHVCPASQADLALTRDLRNAGIVLKVLGARRRFARNAACALEVHGLETQVPTPRSSVKHARWAVS
mmetsp:Transcript_18392/g.36065  ORF Transcript_18392/g.36065 Transcript_18392/m.36065 type:complete len:210 (+) Transcript_18392:150-779(+)